MRRIVYFLLLLCLPLYGFAMQGSLASVAGAASLIHGLELGLEHEVAHNAGVYHHHDDDGSVHYDESDASLDHAQECSSPAQPASFGFARLMVPPEQAVAEPGSYIAQAIPEPFLDGPHRPPAFALGHAAGGMPHA